MEPPKVRIEDLVSETAYFRSNIEQLLRYLHPTFHCLKLIVKILLAGPDGCGKRILARLIAKKLNTKFCEEQAFDLFDDNIVGTEKKIRTALSKYSSAAPCLIYLTGYELFCCLEEPDLDRVEYVIKDTLEELSEKSNQPIIFIGATNEFDRVYGTPLSEIFQHVIQMKPPTLEGAKDIVKSLSETINFHSDPMELLKSSGTDLYLGNLLHLVTQSELNYFIEAIGDVEATERTDPKIDEKKSEGTRWVDIGGLNHVKKDIIDTIQLCIDFPQLKKTGLRRTGILLYGPPGTGKTLLAKAVATECKLNFINIKGPELLNEYVGQSEDNVRKLFRKARESSPCVIFFDEIDSLAPNRGQAGDSGGVMDRIVSQLLAEIDGVGRNDDIFIIGATNRVDLVDSSLLRPGRFDKVLEVPIPSDREQRLQILYAITRKMKLADDVNLEELESIAPINMSGADFQGLCSRAMQRTFDRCVQLVESGQSNEDEVEIITTYEDFLEPLRVLE